MKESKQQSALLALLVLSAIWGYAWVVMKIGVQYAPPFAFAAIRAAFGAGSLFLVMLCLRKPLVPQQVGKLILLGLLQTGGMIGLPMWALVSGGAGKTSVLCYTMPFWVLLFAWVFLGERLKREQWVYVGLAVAGLVCVLMPLDFTEQSFSKVVAILAGLCWGLSAIIVKKINQAGSIDLLSLTAWQMLFGSVPLVLAALLVPAPPIQWTGTLIAALGYVIVPATAIAYILWLYALTHLSAGTAGLGTLANPVVGVLMAWLVLGEVPNGAEAIGMVLIGTALALNTLQALKLRSTAAGVK
ncbi:EamA family transporter [Phormidium tenue FACHB-886]|nr:EamA family transporter [Phormidium tenue FACHB-886]